MKNRSILLRTFIMFLILSICFSTVMFCNIHFLSKASDSILGNIDKTRTAFDENAGGNDWFGANLLDDGKTLVEFSSRAFNPAGFIANSKSTYNLNNFEAKLDLTELIPDVSTGHDYPALTFTSSKNAFGWQNELVIRAMKLSGNYYFRFSIGSGHDSANYANADGIFQVNSGENPIVNVYVTDSEDTLTFHFNDSSFKISKSDFGTKIFGVDYDLTKIYFGLTGESPENSSITHKIKIWDIADSSTKQNIEKVSSFVNYLNASKTAVTSEEITNVTSIRSSLDFDTENLRSYESEQISYFYSIGEQYYAKLFLGQYDNLTPFNYLTAGAENWFGSILNADGSYSISFNNRGYEASANIVNKDFGYDLKTLSMTIDLRGIIADVTNGFECPGIVFSSDNSAFAYSGQMFIRPMLIGGNYYFRFSKNIPHDSSLYSNNSGLFQVNSGVNPIVNIVVVDSDSSITFKFNEVSFEILKTDLCTENGFFGEGSTLDNIYMGFCGLSSLNNDGRLNIFTVSEITDSKTAQYNQTTLAYRNSINDFIASTNDLSTKEKLDSAELILNNLDLDPDSASYTLNLFREYDKLSFIEELNSAKEKFESYKENFEQAKKDSDALAIVENFEDLVNNANTKILINETIDYYNNIDTELFNDVTNKEALLLRIQNAYELLQNKLEEVIQEEKDAKALAIVEDFERDVNNANTREEIENQLEIYQNIDKQIIEAASNKDELLERIEECKEILSNKLLNLEDPTELTMGRKDSRVPYGIVGSNGGTYFNENTGMYEMVIHGDFGGRNYYQNSIDLTDFEITIDVSKLPVSQNVNTPFFLIFSGTVNGYTQSNSEISSNPDCDIPLILGLTNFGSVYTVHFWRNWFVDGNPSGFPSDPDQLCSTIGLPEKGLLKITAKENGEYIDFQFNNGVVLSAAKTDLIGESSQVFGTNNDLKNVYLGFGTNLPTYTLPDSDNEGREAFIAVSRIIDSHTKEYLNNVTPVIELIQDFKNAVNGELDSNMSIAIAKAKKDKIEMSDFELFNKSDKVIYQKIYDDCTELLEAAIGNLSDYDPEFSLAKMFINLSNEIQDLDDIREAMNIYSQLSDDEKAQSNVMEAMDSIKLFQQIPGWTKEGGMLSQKGQTSILYQGQNYSDLLVSDSKFLATNFVIDLKLNNIASGWFGIGLMAQKKGFNSGVTMDTAEDDRGIFLMISLKENNVLKIEVYMIKLTTQDMWSARRGEFETTIDDTKMLKIRFYESEDYVEIEANSQKLRQGRIKVTDLNGVLGADKKGYISLMTCSSEDITDFYSIELKYINNKSVFDTGVTNPDINNLPKDEPEDNTQDNGDSNKNKSCKNSLEMQSTIITLCMACIAVFVIKRKIKQK